MRFPMLRSSYIAFSPTAIANLFMGVGVLEYPKGKPRPVMSAIWSTIQFALWILIYNIADFAQILEAQGLKIAATNYRFSSALLFTSHFVVIILEQISDKYTRKRFRNLDNINEMLKLHGIPTDYNYIFKSQIIWLLVTFVSIICIISLDTAISDMEFYGTIPKICFLTYVTCSTVLQFVTDLTFNNFLRYLRNRLQHVNTLIPNILFKRHPQSTNAANSEKNQVYLITDIREIHYSICSMASEYNTAMGIQILLSMTTSFLSSLAQMFKLYVMLVLVDSCPYNSTRTLHFYCLLYKLIRAMPLVLFSTKIFLMIHVCVATSYEANRTGQLLAELQIATINGHEKFRREIDIFLLQLIQNPLRFTAYEFFVLDFTAIHRMIGTVTTLLLLQVQMHDIHDQASGNSETH